MIRRTSTGLFAVGRLFSWLRAFSSAADFEAAQKRLHQLPAEPDVDVKLRLYGLYKQGSAGDATRSRPGAFDFAGRAKFDAWKANAGLSMEEAQKQYIALVDSLAGGSETAAGSSTVSDSTAPASGGVDGLEVEKRGNVFRITLNRPDKFNAITWQMYDAWTAAMESASVDRDTAVTVIGGNGPYYCSGNDLSNFAIVKSPVDLAAMAERAGAVFDRFVRVFIEHQKPLIVLVNGPAIGISVTLLALADLVIASDKSTFQTPFTSLGQSPEGCSSYTFPFLMGPSKASEVLLFGKKLTAEEALERNLIARIVPHAQFAEEAKRLVVEYAALPPESLRLNKQLLRNVHIDNLHRNHATELKLLKSRWQSAECAAALTKFINRKSN